MFSASIIISKLFYNRSTIFVLLIYTYTKSHGLPLVTFTETKYIWVCNLLCTINDVSITN